MYQLLILNFLTLFPVGFQAGLKRMGLTWLLEKGVVIVDAGAVAEVPLEYPPFFFFPPQYKVGQRSFCRNQGLPLTQLIIAFQLTNICSLLFFYLLKSFTLLNVLHHKLCCSIPVNDDSLFFLIQGQEVVAEEEELLVTDSLLRGWGKNICQV